MGINVFGRKAQQLAQGQIAYDIVAAQLLAPGESIVTMAESFYVGQGRRDWGHVWTLTDQQTIVWLPRERRAAFAIGHANWDFIAGGNRSRDFYVAYIVDMKTKSNLIKDHFREVPEIFAQILDDMSVTGGPHRRQGRPQG